MSEKNDLIREDALYEVTVWGQEGEIIMKNWEATWEEVEAIQSQFADDPMATVDFKESHY